MKKKTFFEKVNKGLSKVSVREIDFKGSLKPKKVTIQKSGRIADGVLEEARNINVRI